MRFTKLTQFRTPKMAFLELLDSAKLISRKIWMTQNSSNFHTFNFKLKNFTKSLKKGWIFHQNCTIFLRLYHGCQKGWKNAGFSISLKCTTNVIQSRNNPIVSSQTKPKNRQNEALKARCEKLTPFCSKLMKNRASRIPQKYQTLCRYMAKKCNEWNFLKYSFKISLLKLCQHKLGIKQNSILYEKRKKYFSDQVLPNGGHY